MTTKTRPAKPAAVPAHDSFSPAPPAEQEPYIGVTEGAALLSIPENTLYKMALARRVPSYKYGKLRRFKASELLAVFAAHRVDAAE